MNRKEIFEKIISHKDSSRLLIDFASTGVSGITLKTYKELRKYLGFNTIARQDIIDTFQGLVYPGEDILSLLGIDFRRVCLINIYKENFGQNEFYDEFGIKFKKNSDYYDAILNPLREIDVKSFDLDDFKLPKIKKDQRIKRLRETIVRYKDSGYLLVGDFVTGGILGLCERLRGMENFLMDLLVNKDLAERLMKKVTVFYKEVNRIFLEIAGPYLDVVTLADDLGMQDSLLFSPDLYRNSIKPRHRELIDYIKSLTDAKVFFHSDGSIYELIPDLIEIGVDILNPIQKSARNMEIKKIKEEFGDNLIFWCGIDTQKIIPFGNLKEVEKEIKDTIKILGKYGGYVFSPGHNLQSDISPKRIIKMFELANSFRV